MTIVLITDPDPVQLIARECAMQVEEVSPEEFQQTVKESVKTVEPRSCGTCVNCCKICGIEELNKPRDQWCQHCEIKGGCKLFGKEDRPKSCREWDCLWKSFPESMPEELRPDKSHVVLGVTAEKVVTAWVDKHYPDAYKSKKMEQFLVMLVSGGIHVVILIGDRRADLMTEDELKKNQQKALASLK